MFGYKYIGVNGSSKFPATAQILAHYLAGEECQLQRTEKLGWGPSNKKVQESKAVTGSPVLKAIGEQSRMLVYRLILLQHSGILWLTLATRSSLTHAILQMQLL